MTPGRVRLTFMSGNKLALRSGARCYRPQTEVLPIDASSRQPSNALFSNQGYISNLYCSFCMSFEQH